MKRIVILLSVFMLSVWAVAQESAYKKLMAEVEKQTPHAALYHLRMFQGDHPTYAPVYLEMALRERELARPLHPIRDYQELALHLYSFQLYLGNYIHYSGSKNPSLPLHLDSARLWRADVEMLYSRYVAVEERYNRCRAAYTAFLTRYPGEKNAHLLLQPEDMRLVEQLVYQADSLHDEVEQYRALCRTYGRNLTVPSVRYMPIRLYRIDGLTAPEWLSDTLHFWDYATWARRFAEEHHTVYADYRRHLNGALLSEQVSDTLLYTIDRLDNGSFLRDYLFLIQCQHAWPSLPDTGAIVAPEAMECVWAEHELLTQASAAGERAKASVSEEAWQKYGLELRTHGARTPEELSELADRRLRRLQQAYLHSCRTVYAALAPEWVDYTSYTHPLSGETTMLSDLLIPEALLAEAGEVVAVIPVDGSYLVATRHGLIHSRAPERLLPVELPSVRAAIKLSSSRIALIGEENIIFVNENGQVL